MKDIGSKKIGKYIYIDCISNGLSVCAGRIRLSAAELRSNDNELESLGEQVTDHITEGAVIMELNQLNCEWHENKTERFVKL